MSGFGGFKRLLVWQKALLLDGSIQVCVSKFPKHEVYGLMSQINRASASVPANIAEGHERNSTKEFINFLGFARGSLGELQTHLIIAKNRNYISSEELDSFEERINEIARMLWKLKEKLKEKS